MSFEYTVRLGIRSLGRRKLQSSLSVLGIVMGVAAVITMLSIGQGARREALEQIDALGTDLLVIRGPDTGGTGVASDPAPRAQSPGQGKRFEPLLTLDDAERLDKRFPKIGIWAPAVARIAEVQSGAGWMVEAATVVGTTAGALVVRRLEVRQGRFLADSDRSQGGRAVCVLGADLARQLFPDASASGQLVRLEGRWFEVVGVLQPAPFAGGQASIFGVRGLDDALFVPLEALPGVSSFSGDIGLDEIGVRLGSHLDVRTTARAMRAGIEELETIGGSGVPGHSGIARGPAGAGPDRAAAGEGRSGRVRITYPEELLEQAAQTVRIFNLVMGSIAGISLIVGGIGIMNVMLLTVSERRREIGIRRALGAKKAQIAWYFLAESLILTTAGGLLGVFLGTVAAGSITWFVGWATLVSPAVILVSLVVAALVGLGFGFYPAWRAAGLDPVDAIRMSMN